MTTINMWFKQYNYNDFLTEKYSFMESRGVVLNYEKPYNADTIYAINDTITSKDSKDYCWYYYISLQNGNQGNNLTDEEYWQKGSKIERLFTEEDFNIAKSIVENLNFFALNKNKNDYKYKNLMLLCLCSYCFNFTNGFNDMTVNSASIDGMSIGGEVSEIVKTYPWLNNSIGLDYLFQRTQLIGVQDIYGKATRKITTYTTNT